MTAGVGPEGVDDADRRYLEAVVTPLRRSASYQPRFGLGSEAGVGLREFRDIYGSDPFYSWFGLDHPLMYTAHRAAGGMTSIYRQIGIGCEMLFRAILKDELGLSEEQASWSHDVSMSGGKRRVMSLDAAIPLAAVGDSGKRDTVREWMDTVAVGLGLDADVGAALKGIVFEIRQGYKSKDSKRQQADLANAAAAYSRAYLPVLLVFSTQIDIDVAERYSRSRWTVLTGVIGANANTVSTYAFVRDIIGFDLEAFFFRNQDALRSDLVSVLESLLKVD